MKKFYVKPCVENFEVQINSGIMASTPGEIDPTHGMAKSQSLIDDDEEDEFETETASVEPQVFFSNDYIKEVWN